MGLFSLKNKLNLSKIKMASAKNSVNIVRQVKPLLSVSRNEARLRTLALYKAWQRQVYFICDEYDIPVSEKNVRDKVKEKFLANAKVKDTRVIDMLVVRDNKICKKLLKNGNNLPTLCQNISQSRMKQDQKISCQNF